MDTATIQHIDCEGPSTSKGTGMKCNVGNSSSDSNMRRKSSGYPVSILKKRRPDFSEDNSINESNSMDEPKKLKITLKENQTDERIEFANVGRCFFPEGYVAKKILGVYFINRQFMFAIKWKDRNEIDLVPTKRANVICPQQVIKYYEQTVRDKLL